MTVLFFVGLTAYGSANRGQRGEAAGAVEA
jgi:hypothetical protein